MVIVAVKNFLRKIKTLPIDIGFFFLFLLTFTLSIRKVLFYFPIQRTFNEYTGIYVYMSDIFLFLAIGSWLICLLYNYIYKSSNKFYSIFYQVIHSLSKKIVDKLSITPRSIFQLSAYRQLFHACLSGRQVKQLGLNVMLSLLVILSLLSIFWSTNVPIAVFRSIKIIEYYLLFLYVGYRFVPYVPRGTLKKATLAFRQKSEPVETKNIESISTAKKQSNFPPAYRTGRRETILSFNCSTWNIFVFVILIVAATNSLIGITQFLIQHSLGLTILRESFISPITPGVAKIVFHACLSGRQVEHYVRSYGLFPHPNIFGGFLIFSIILSWGYSKCSTWNTNTIATLTPEKNSDKDENVPRGTNSLVNLVSNYYFSIEKFKMSKKWLLKALLLIQFIALFLTFSKSAWLGLAIAFLYIQYTMVSRLPHDTGDSLRRETFRRMFHACLSGRQVKQFKKIFLLFLIFIFSIILVKPNFHSIFLKSLEERNFYLDVSRGTIMEHPVSGVGMGQFVVTMEQFSKQKLETWQYQPVHNVFLLVWSELGMIGVLLFGLLIFEVLKPEKINIVPRRTINLIKNMPTYVSRETQLDNIPNDEKPITDYQKSTFSPESENILFPNENVPRETKTAMKNESVFCSTCLPDRQAWNIFITYTFFKGIFLGFTFIMLFDHYFWDIQQGSILLWLTAGLIYGIKRTTTP